MKEKFDDLCDRAKTLEEKMLIQAIRLIAIHKGITPNMVYCDIERVVEAENDG